MDSPRQAPKPAQFCTERMSEQDLATYFELRRLHDQKPEDMAEQIAFQTKAIELLANEGPAAAVAFFKTMNIPLDPATALTAKHVWGLKAVQEFNLYQAKEVYPDEF